MILKGLTKSSSKTLEFSQESWLASVYWDDNKKVAQFAFVDNGVGIFNTIKAHLAKDYFKLKIKDNISLLKMILENQINLTSTRKPYRGKGLKLIYRYFKSGYLKRLIIVTNYVFLDFEKNVELKLNVEFRGTFFYWEVNNDCLQNQYCAGFQ